jgi:hypothetical protein
MARRHGRSLDTRTRVIEFRENAMNALRPSLRNDSFVSFIAGILVAALMLMGGPTSYASAPLLDEPCCGNSPPVALVEETAESVLTPVEQHAASPESLYELIVVLDSLPVPAPWTDAGGSITIPATGISLREP